MLHCSINRLHAVLQSSSQRLLGWPTLPTHSKREIAMAQIANTGAEKAADTAKNTTDNLAEVGKRTADQTAEVTREAAERTAAVARRGVQAVRRTVEAAAEVESAVAHRSAEATTELGQAFLDLVQQQTRHNLETLTALADAVDWERVAKAVDWERVVEIQSAFVRASLERATQLTQRYFAVGQAVTVSAADAAKRQVRKAA
jgi:hypothetical protein